MFELMIADLITEEEKFEIPSILGKWEFVRTSEYDQILESIEKGMCGNTFTVFNKNVNTSISYKNFDDICDEIIDICLILSFITSKCVTVSRSAPFSEILFIQMGDCFLRSRPIDGFKRLELKVNLQELFKPGIKHYQKFIIKRNLRLFLSHWISSLTCFTLEDLFLTTCVEMDIVKQCLKIELKEEMKSEKKLSHEKGKKEIFEKYKINEQWYENFKNMRNDLIHEGSLFGENFKKIRNNLIHKGTLSGENFKNKSKLVCASVIAETLNWIDLYVIKVLNISNFISEEERWISEEIYAGLPSISLYL